MATRTIDKMIDQIVAERTHQDSKWGEQNHDDYVWLAILSEEVGEAAQAILKVNDSAEGVNEWQESDIDAELIQVAAVAIAWLEARARRRNGSGCDTGN